MNAVTLPVIYRGAKPRVDGSFNISFDTRELSEDEMAGLHRFNMKECQVSVMPLGSDAPTDSAPTYKASNPALPKSPSKALRDELWAYYNRRAELDLLSADATFEAFYEATMKTYLLHWHDKRIELSS